ncbi:hypothetical protein TNCV_1694551 [Trichonephila clavipes]|nr:hypothetical protein TNCV_1694551 [Trichonephila clavipes]
MSSEVCTTLHCSLDKLIKYWMERQIIKKPVRLGFSNTTEKALPASTGTVIAKVRLSEFSDRGCPDRTEGNGTRTRLKRTTSVTYIVVGHIRRVSLFCSVKKGRCNCQQVDGMPCQRLHHTIRANICRAAGKPQNPELMWPYDTEKSDFTTCSSSLAFEPVRCEIPCCVQYDIPETHRFHIYMRVVGF